MRIATESPVDFVSGVTHALLSAATFIVVLWTIGGALDVSIAGIQLHVPGFLVLATLAYALLASGAMVLVGRRFVSAFESKNQSEAEYRYLLTRLRENGESVALIQGEEEERAGLARSLRKVLSAWRDIAVQTIKTTSVSQILRLHRSRTANHSVRSQVLRRVVVPWASHASRIGVYYRTGCLQLAGGQLSQARGLDRLGAPSCVAHGFS